MPLTAQELPKKPVGKHSDGSGLLFRVTTGGTRDWCLKVQHKGKRKEYSLGKYPNLGLSDARAKAREWRVLSKAGADPRDKNDAASSKSCAEAYISTKLNNASKKTRQHPFKIFPTLSPNGGLLCLAMERSVLR